MERFRTLFGQLRNTAYWSLLVWKLLICIFVFLVLWAFFDTDALPPNGTYFHLLMIFIAAHILGNVSFLCHLPALFGMLVAGFAYGNVLNIQLDKTITSGLRSLALMIILLRAGLSLDPGAIRKLSFVCFRLAFGPCLVEAITVAVSAYLFFGLNLAWSLMLGFVLAAVSPAVVVPGMIRMQGKSLGTKKGIPTLIIAAASVDDVLAITGFSVCLGFAFSNSTDKANDTWNLIFSILKGPIEAAVGVIFGTALGILLWIVPEKCNSSKKRSNPQANANNSSKYDLHRFLLLLLGGIFALFGSQKLDFGGAGPLAILVLSFIACLRWRPMGFDAFNEAALKKAWTLFQHFLFALIGADVRLKDMKSDILLYGLACLLIGLTLRTAAAYLVTYGNGLTLRERLFIAIAWLPKATVQAAIGPVALDMAMTNGTSQERAHGQLILTIAVLSILLTAPLGAIAIDVCSTLMLKPDEGEDGETEETANCAHLPDNRSLGSHSDDASSVEMQLK